MSGTTRGLACALDWTVWLDLKEDYYLRALLMRILGGAKDLPRVVGVLLRFMLNPWNIFTSL